VSDFAVYLTLQAQVDLEKLKSCGTPCLERRFADLVNLLKRVPHADRPPVKRLIGPLKGLWVRRLNDKHRVVYRIDGEQKAVVIVSVWTWMQSFE
jgi:Txe/YoeB family toxin of toxin-antitoxin system